jgi:hypothetical protein
MKSEDYPKFVQSNYQYLREAYIRDTLKPPLKDFCMTEMKKRVDPLLQRSPVNPVMNTAGYNYQAPERISPVPYTPEYSRSVPYTSYYQGPASYYSSYTPNDPCLLYLPPPMPPSMPPMSYTVPVASHYQPVSTPTHEPRPIQNLPPKPLSLKEKLELSGIVKKDVEDNTQTRDPRLKAHRNNP